MPANRPNHILLLLFLAVPLSSKAADIISAGHGEATVHPLSKKQKEIDKANGQALDQANSLAIEDAVTNAIYKTVGRSRVPDGERVGREAARHRSEFTLREETTGTRAVEGIAVVEVRLTIDRDRLASYLGDIIGTETTQNFDHHVYLLAYTVEGIDPNRAESRKREVVVWQSGYQHNLDEAHDVGASEKVRESATDQRVAASAQSDHLQERSVHATNVNDYLLGLSRDHAGANASDYQTNGAQAAASATTYNGGADRDFHDIGHLKINTAMASSYIRVTDFADNTKKNAGQTNEVRAMLEGVLTKAGLDLSFYPLRLMNMYFATEDDLAGTVLDALRDDPNIGPDDYIAIATNRLTPINNAHGYTSQVIYRIMRKKDMNYLLPPKVVTGEIFAQSSDDLGRTLATEMAVKRAADVIPTELNTALTRYERRNRR